LYTTGSCPTGWADYGNPGEYFVGASASLESTVGTALTNQENRATGTHNHTSSTSLSVSVSAHNHSVSDSGHYHGGEDGYGSADLVGGGGGDKLGDGSSRSARVAGVDVSGNISVDNTDTDVSVTGTSASISDYSGTAGTNAPYIQLRGCRKS
jgi:hypothetical protein